MQPLSAEMMAAWNVYLAAANATALVVQTSATNAALAVGAESDARNLVVFNLIVAAEAVRSTWPPFLCHAHVLTNACTPTETTRP